MIGGRSATKGGPKADDIVRFIRERDLRFVSELGHGACGRTVLLHDDDIDQKFVCKKYAPLHEPLREELFKNFVREIKLLHLLFHRNVVRVFNYYLYPKSLAGYILMEYVEGTDIETYLRSNPSEAGRIFLQLIDGFDHLESNRILHRDIRSSNVMVSDDGFVKIIDLGFGKGVDGPADFKKSITLNWWCELPLEFQSQIYDFGTEVYFVGRLFAQAVANSEYASFENSEILQRMCLLDPALRFARFSEIKQVLLSGVAANSKFTQEQRQIYQSFANGLCSALAKVRSDVQYIRDPEQIERLLSEAYSAMMLEDYSTSPGALLKCFVRGHYYFARSFCMPVSDVEAFLLLLRKSPPERQEIIVSNILSRLDAIPRYVAPDPDIPF